MAEKRFSYETLNALADAGALVNVPKLILPYYHPITDFQMMLNSEKNSNERCVLMYPKIKMLIIRSEIGRASCRERV